MTSRGETAPAAGGEKLDKEFWDRERYSTMMRLNYMAEGMTYTLGLGADYKRDKKGVITQVGEGSAGRFQSCTLTDADFEKIEARLAENLESQWMAERNADGFYSKTSQQIIEGLQNVAGFMQYLNRKTAEHPGEYGKLGDKGRSENRDQLIELLSSYAQKYGDWQKNRPEALQEKVDFHSQVRTFTNRWLSEWLEIGTNSDDPNDRWNLAVTFDIDDATREDLRLAAEEVETLISRVPAGTTVERDTLERLFFVMGKVLGREREGTMRFIVHKNKLEETTGILSRIGSSATA